MTENRSAGQRQIQKKAVFRSRQRWWTETPMLSNQWAGRTYIWNWKVEPARIGMLSADHVELDEGRMPKQRSFVSSASPAMSDTRGCPSSGRMRRCTENLKTRVHLRDNGVRPYIELEPTNHPLAVEQRPGIAVERVAEFMPIMKIFGPRRRPADASSA